MAFLIRLSKTMKSYNLALGASCAFVVLSALATLASGRHDVDPVGGEGWALRGTLTPLAFQASAPAKRPAASRQSSL